MLFSRTLYFRLKNDLASKKTEGQSIFQDEIGVRLHKNKESYTGLDYINDAIDIINQRLEIKPDFSLYVMVKCQLDYIKTLLIGAEKDKIKLHALNLGALASKEFDTTDAELAEHLSNANYIASQMGQGLKIILPHEQDLEYLKRQKRYRN